MTAIHGSRRSVWLWPIVLGILSGVGLVAALLGDGAWNLASWVGLGIPVAICAWFGFCKQRTQR